MTINQLEKLKKSVKKGEVSNFFAEAAAEKLKKDQSDRAWNELMELTPMFEEVKDPAKWIKDLRKTDDKRLKKLNV